MFRLFLQIHVSYFLKAKKVAKNSGGNRSDAFRKTQIRQLLALEFVFFSGTEGAGFASAAPK